MNMRKWLIYSSIIVILVGLDILTKRWALLNLNIGETVPFIGFIPFTLTFNDGGGFSLSFGEASRLVFTAVAFVIFIAMFGYLLRLRENLFLRIIAISMISAGAIGNLIDRVRWDLGVVDFIGPIDLGFMLWPIFNVADMSVSVGGVLLILSLWLDHPEKVTAQIDAEQITVQSEEPPCDEIRVEES